MPSFTTKAGYSLAYDLAGSGPLVILTPGGREGRAGIRSLIDAMLAEKFTVLSWDRCNGGESEVYFGGAPLAEAEIWADDLADLVAHIGLGPAWIVGGSGGCRTSVAAVLRRPEAAKGMIVWSASGGEFASQFLGFQYHVPYIVAAHRGGMQAVADGPYWSDRTSANPANRDRLLAVDPQDFIATMKRWMSMFYHRADCTLIGATDAQLATIAMPTLVFEGNDDVHPKFVSDAMARLIPGATYLPSPWTGEEFVGRFSGRIAKPVMELYPSLVPHIGQFIRAHE